jgi:hypothetical protein
MNTVERKAMGSLKVHIDSDSVYFSHNVPIEIRDNQMRLVQKKQGHRQFDLAAGLYQISAVLEDGQEHKHFVRVQDGETANVTMGANTQMARRVERVRKAMPNAQSYHRPRFTKTLQSLALESKPSRATKAKPTSARNKSRRKTSTRGLAAGRLPDINLDELKTIITKYSAFPDGEDWGISDATVDLYVEQMAEMVIEQEEDEEPDTLISLSGAHRLEEQQNPWMIKCDNQVSEVPTAKVAVGNEEYVISLPTSPHDSPAYNSCVVTLETIYSKQHVVAWISPSRTVANAIQNMMASNEYHKAREMAGEATELLRSKYVDPTGATLGALVLHKFGLLSEKLSWLENLVRDFAWIPDAKILLAATLIQQAKLTESERDRAFQLALEASEQRILYTESFSLVLDLLRRWPDQEHEPTLRKQAISRLAYQSAMIDWDSICMNIKQED